MIKCEQCGKDTDTNAITYQDMVFCNHICLKSYINDKAEPVVKPIRNNKYMAEKGEATRLAILNAGLKLWPYATPSKIAREVGITHAAVLYHFTNVRDAVAFHAVQVGDELVINYLRLEGHPAVEGL